MKRLALILALPMVASCTDQHYYAEEFSLYYDKPAGETTSDRIERREIVHWAKNPKEKKRIGFLHQYETKVVGSRKYRDSWYIFDSLGKTRIGFITDEGVFYRFDASGPPRRARGRVQGDADRAEGVLRDPAGPEHRPGRDRPL